MNPFYFGIRIQRRDPVIIWIQIKFNYDKNPETHSALTIIRGPHPDYNCDENPDLDMNAYLLGSINSVEVNVVLLT